MCLDECLYYKYILMVTIAANWPTVLPVSPVWETFR